MTTLLRLTEPWLHISHDSEAELTTLGWGIAGESNGRVVRFLRGSKMRNVEALFNEVAAALQFPHYFGENWNALDECLTDMSWAPAESYVLVILNGEDLLVDEPPKELEVFIRLLDRAGEEWSHPVTAGDSSNRPGISFHVVFQMAIGTTSSLKSRLTVLNLLDRFVPLPRPAKRQ